MVPDDVRRVIVHYHLFKNAGTSIDELLKRNFPGRWASREFESGSHARNVAEVGRWIEDNKAICAFSSHTALLPPPSADGLLIFPIVFLRHPIDRIASAYRFESRQGTGTFGAVLARHTTFSGYVEVRLSLKSDRQCRNFQVARLAHAVPGPAADEGKRAIQAVEALPFVGLVDRFEESIRRLEEWLQPHFAGFEAVPIAMNVTIDHSEGLEERLDRIRSEIGQTMYEGLVEANREDLELYEFAAARF